MTHRLRRSGMIDMESNVTLVQQFPAHEAVPEGGGPFPAVVVLHDARGLTVSARGYANRLAREGYYVLAPNLFAHPFSVAAGAPAWMSSPAAIDGGDPAGESEARAANLAHTRSNEIIARAFGHLALEAEADPDRAALLGFGIGGRAAFRGACELGERVRALVVYAGAAIASPYSPRPVETMPILEFEGLRAPSLFFYGEQDGATPPAERAAVDRVLSAAGLPHEIVAFREAAGAFYDEESEDHRIAASRAAWEKTIAFLESTLSARPAGGPGGVIPPGRLPSRGDRSRSRSTARRS